MQDKLKKAFMPKTSSIRPSISTDYRLVTDEKQTETRSMALAAGVKVVCSKLG